jgi:hypothetical protein
MFWLKLIAVIIMFFVTNYASHQVGVFDGGGRPGPVLRGIIERVRSRRQPEPPPTPAPQPTPSGPRHPLRPRHADDVSRIA